MEKWGQGVKKRRKWLNTNGHVRRELLRPHKWSAHLAINCVAPLTKISTALALDDGSNCEHRPKENSGRK